jgi:hypothetical protein
VVTRKEDKCLFGKLNHHWILDEAGNGICKKCKKKKKFETQTETNDRMFKEQFSNSVGFVKY